MMLNREQVLKDLGQCARCRQCRMVCEVPIAQTMLPICPSGEYFKFDTYFGSGRVTLAKKVLLGSIDLDESVVKAVYSCCLCGSCKQQCPILGFDPIKATMVLREIAVEKGLADSVYIMPDCTPIQISLDGDLASKTALFVGTVAQSDAETVTAVAAALKNAGVTFRALQGTDCGEYLLRKGDTAAFEERRNEVTALLKREGITRLIVHDPLTYKVLKADYDLALQGIEVVFYLEPLADKVVKKAQGVKAVFHDPSYLGRWMEMYEPPRKALAGLGYELVEMKRTRENALSAAAYPDYIKAVADQSAAAILQEAEEAGAELLVTADRNASKQLAETAARLKSPVSVKNIAFLL